MTDLVVVTDWAWLLGLLGLGSAAGVYGYVKKQPSGSETMRDLGEQIHDGAMAFLRREYSMLAIFVVVVAVLLSMAIGRTPAVAYVFGALSSVAAGFSRPMTNQIPTPVSAPATSVRSAKNLLRRSR